MVKHLTCAHGVPLLHYEGVISIRPLMELIVMVSKKNNDTDMLNCGKNMLDNGGSIKDVNLRTALWPVTDNTTESDYLNRRPPFYAALF